MTGSNTIGTEGRLYTEWMREVADKVRRIMDKPPGKRDWEVSAMLVAPVKSNEGLSHGGLVKHSDKHPEDLERCELYRPCSNRAVPTLNVGD